MSDDRTILRDVVKQYVEVAGADIQNERRNLWRRHNSLKRTRPLIYVRAFAWNEFKDALCRCQDPFYRAFETKLRMEMMRASFNDDSIFEPWLNVPAVHKCSGWGVDLQAHRSEDPHGSFKIDYPIKSPEDVSKLRPPRHEIDECATADIVSRIGDAVGDLITINVDRRPAYSFWNADLSTDLGWLRGIENVMMDMMDRPEWLHQLLAFMRDGVLRAQAQAEAAGDWNLSAHQNQAMPYAEELADPAANVNDIKRKQLWVFCAAQELTLVSPRQHDEFMLQYQLPIIREFGLCAYGCCENLTNKISMLRQIPNLRRIAVAPAANVAKCSEQIGKDYVLSYRPSPADMVSYGFDEARIRGILKRDLEACRDCHVDITLKDVETVQNEEARPKRWVEITRNVIDEVFGG